MKFFSTLFKVLVGVVFGIFAGAALSPLLASFSDGSGAVGLLVMMAAGGVLGGFAPTMRRAFGRGFLITGVCIFILPLSSLVLSGVVMNETVNAASEADKGYAVIGSGIAGGLFTGLASLVGFFLGTAFLITGLILSLGGRREVTVVQSPKRRSSKEALGRKEPRLK